MASLTAASHLNLRYTCSCTAVERLFYSEGNIDSVLDICPDVDF
jgi:hypothetical protein